MSDVTPQSFTPANRLEALLIEAAGDPGKRPAFYRELLGSQLLALGSSDEAPSASGMLAAGSTVSIQHWENAEGETAIPVFTSLPRLQEAITEQTSYMLMDVRDLFELPSAGTGFILNPRSAYGKRFTPEEVASLLDGSIFAQVEANIIQTGQQVLLGQPEPSMYPHKLVDALKSLFAQHPQVRRAYLALMYAPSLEQQQQQPHPIIGIEAEGDFSLIMQDVGILLNDVAEKGQAINFVQMKPSDGVSDYMISSVEPFYVGGDAC